MIRLFGVVHGGEVFDFLYGSRPITVHPTHGLRTCIEGLPKGSKVGIEYLGKDDWKEVKEHLSDLCWEEAGCEAGYAYGGMYWDLLESCCKNAGHEVVWLENKDVWFKYNEATVEFAKVRKKYDDLYHEKGESDRDYHKKLVELNEERHRAIVGRDKVHLLDRDEAILQNISSSGVEVVVAGLGHTSAWLLEKNRIREEFGIEFGKYSTDSVSDAYRGTLSFTGDAVPDANVAYDFKKIRKSASLIENGSLTGKTPDWTGLWQMTEPSDGYFELFIEGEENLRTIGIIEDPLGTAKFRGELTPRFARFLKQYGDSTTDAIKTDLHYHTDETSQDRDMRHGTWRCAGGGGGFYIQKANCSSPAEMAMSWYDLIQDDRSGQKTLF